MVDCWKEMISSFFTMTKSSCNSKMWKVLQPSLFGRLLGRHSFQVALSIKTWESRSPPVSSGHSHCQLGETCRINETWRRCSGSFYFYFFRGTGTLSYYVLTPPLRSGLLSPEEVCPWVSLSTVEEPSPPQTPAASVSFIDLLCLITANRRLPETEQRRKNRF